MDSKQIKLSKSIGKALQSGLQRAQVLKSQADSANAIYQNTAQTISEMVQGVIEDSGNDFKDFASFDVAEVNGEFFLRSVSVRG